MYRISELANKVGLSRTALLYYEKLQLITSERSENGYRLYSEGDIQRIKLLMQLQSGGLTLKECKACLEEKIDRELLKNRLRTLDEEISEKQKSRELLAAMLGGGGEKSWHLEASTQAPDAHLEWLITQGFNEKEALRLKWLSRNMTEHEQYMSEFMTVYEPLERWGPGSKSDTLRAFSLLTQLPKNILEIGCGKGLTTVVLAENCTANITAVDNELSVINFLTLKIQNDGLNSRVTPLCVSMTELPFDNSSFDLIWAEGCAYIMGVKNALSKWKPLLKDGGILVLSDLVWLTNNPSQEAKVFFEKEYPDMQTADTRYVQAEMAGYKVLNSFTISASSWKNYYEPLKKRVEDLSIQMQDSAVLKDIRNEIDIYTKFIKEYGYQMYILRKD